MMAVRGHIFILDFAVVVEVVLLFKMSISLIFWGGELIEKKICCPLAFGNKLST